MQRRYSIFRSALAIAIAGHCGQAWGQACCSGPAAITPARVGPHDEALVGVQVQAANAFGSYGATGGYRRAAPGTSEYDLEQDVFGAIRVFRNGQISLLVPFLETHRSTPTLTEFGGGIGDINLGARYDLIRTQQFKFVPGIALLGGLTLPTGTSPDAARKPLATDATGVGAVQGIVGVALEHVEGHWLVTVTGMVAKRAAHSARGVDETLGTQAIGVVAGGYTFDNEVTVGLVASYAAEANATINGVEAPSSSRRTVTARAVGLVPVSDALFVQGGIFANPPLDGWGKNGPASFGLTLALVRTWS